MALASALYIGFALFCVKDEIQARLAPNEDAAQTAQVLRVESD